MKLECEGKLLSRSERGNDLGTGWRTPDWSPYLPEIMTFLNALRRYLLPGFVFQSVVIAGGYGTGRELAEFFLSEGPLGGLLAMGVSTLVWSGVCMVSYEFARSFQVFDYRTFFQELLGSGWVLFEGCYILLLIIILAVIAAASGAILEETFGLSYWVGVAGAMVAVGGLVLGGSQTIERVMAGWSVVLYTLYIVFFVWCVTRFGGEISSALAVSKPGTHWVVGGVEYAAYNVALIPALLFSVRHARSRKETLTAGFLTGPIAMIPAFLFFFAMVGQYPQILDRPVPANYLLELLGSRAFQICFQVVLFGTLIETGTGLIHGVNERIAHVFTERGREMPGVVRLWVALGLLVVGTGLARFGIIDLIAKGYGTLTWAFLFLFVIPVLTLGIWKIVRRDSGH